MTTMNPYDDFHKYGDVPRIFPRRRQVMRPLTWIIAVSMLGGCAAGILIGIAIEVLA
jgi:hypothetical protein